MKFYPTGFGNSGWHAVLALLCFGAVQVQAQVEEYVRSIEGDQLVLNRSGKLVWKATTPTALSNKSHIDSYSVDDRWTVGGRQLLPWGVGAASNTNPLPGAIAVKNDDLTVFYFESGFIYEVSDRGLQLRRPVPDANRITPVSHLAAVGNYFFLTDETGEFLDQARLWRVEDPWSGPEPAPELIADRSTGPGATWFRAIIPVSSNEVLALLGNNRLSRFVRTHFPDIDHAWVEFTVASNAFCMTPHVQSPFAGGDRLAWATINAAQTHVSFYSAPIANLAAAVLLGTEATPSPQPFASMAVADNRLFYQIGGSLRRRSAVAFDAASEEVAALDHEAKSLCSTDRYVCWLRNGNTVMRLPVGAAAIQRNLAIVGMEVIQAVQSPSNDVPLVAAKPTQVRVFAQILSSSAGESALTLSSPMVLHGSVGGWPMPGSPLVPDPVLGIATITTNAPVRVRVAAATNEPPWRNPQEGFWFRLPESWTANGTIALRAELNPARALRETNYADNVRTVNATFTQKVPIGIKVIPARTHYGTIDRRRSDHREMFEQAALLLPTSELRVEYPRTPPIEERDGFLGLDGTSPYEFVPTDDDTDSVLIALFWRKIEGVGGTLAEPGGFDHYMTLIPMDALQNGFSGVGSTGDDISVTHAASLVGHDVTYDFYKTRFSAWVLAHELGHNYGRRHVAGCGNPRNTDSSYPYINGTMSDETAGHLGFNAYRRKLLPLWGTGDLMSYCPNNWISDYTWKHLYNRVGNGYGPWISSARKPSAAPATASLNTRGLVGGVINLTNGTSTIRPVFDLGAEAWGRAITNVGAPGGTYQIRAYEGATLKASYPVGEFYADSDADSGAPQTHRGWVSALDDLSGVDSIRLVSKQNPAVPLVTVNGGKNAPTVTVHKPEAGPVTTDTLNIEWTSADDGPGPLSHVVRISPDAGATWRVLASEYIGSQLTVPVADLPGGATCRVEVVASDGILCGRGVSADFSVPNHPPAARILFENERQPIPTPLATLVVEYGARVVLHAETDDVEDGWLPGSALAWEVSGPVTAAGSGRRFEPGDLPPGGYFATLAATDSAGAGSIATATLIVRPAYLENASEPIELDGVPDDAGYAADRWPKRILYPTGPGAARLFWVRDGDCVVIAVAGLLRGKDENHRLVVGLDPGANAWDAPGPDSLKIEIAESGATRWFRGDGSEWGLSSNETGLVTALSGDAERWNVEIRIKISLLPDGFDALNARFFAGVYDRQSLGDATTFPGGASPDMPSTWNEFALGPDPDSPEDADGDGMPDKWEEDSFGPNGSFAGNHSDADGVPDDEEFIAGTDPNDPESAFVVRADEGNWISWEGKAGRTYSVWRATAVNRFEEVAEGLAPSFYGRTQWLDPAPPGGSVFYRVHARSYR